MNVEVGGRAPEVKERGVVQIERGDEWHQPGQSLNGVLWSRTSIQIIY